MPYKVQGFKSGEKLYAAQLNEMDAQIAESAEDIAAISEENANLVKQISELDEAAFTIETGKNMVNPQTLTQGYLMNDGTTRSDEAYAKFDTSDFIGVKKRTNYTLVLYSPAEKRLSSMRKIVLLYDASKNVIASSYRTVVETDVLTFNSGEAVYVRVSGYTERLHSKWPSVFQMEEGYTYTGYVQYTSGSKVLRDVSPDMLKGKRWVVCGDSFTAGGYTTEDMAEVDENEYMFTVGSQAGKNKVYPHIIAERTGIEVLDFARSGRTLAYPANGSWGNSMTNPDNADYFQNIPEDADYITIYLGINDHANDEAIPLGDANDADATTFFGAWNVVLPWLMVNRPNAHIGIIVSNSIGRVEYRDATIAAVKKWGIPYLDLNGDERCPAMIGTVNPDICSEAKEILLQKWRVSETNAHPNTAAHYYESTFIENWLRTL